MTVTRQAHWLMALRSVSGSPAIAPLPRAQLPREEKRKLPRRHARRAKWKPYWPSPETLANLTALPACAHAGHPGDALLDRAAPRGALGLHLGDLDRQEKTEEKRGEDRHPHFVMGEACEWCSYW